MFFVVGFLQGTAALRLVDREAHGIGHHIGVHDNMALAVSRGTADGLDQGGFGTQETFFIGIQDRHECDFRDVETLTQKVDTDEHIEDIETHITDDLGPFQGVDIGVQVAHADAGLFHIVGQILCHTLRQRRHENFVVFFSFFLYFRNQIVDLSLHRAHLDIRVEKAGRADDLFGAQQLVVCLVVARRGRYEEDLIDPVLELAEVQRAVVFCGRQTESIVHQRRFPRLVAGIHAADLRNSLMRLIHDDEEIISEIVHQCVRRLAWL